MSIDQLEGRDEMSSVTRLASTKRYLIFLVDGQSYGLPLESISEVLAMSTLSRPPGLPPVLAGLLQLEGHAIPVLRLSHLFGAAEVDLKLYTPLIVLRNGPQTLGLLVDNVLRVADVSSMTVDFLPGGVVFNDCAIGIAAVANQTTVLLSVEQLLISQERRRIRELTAIENDRLGLLEEMQT
jgi:purine-binding chemotaxis protein CheW